MANIIINTSGSSSFNFPEEFNDLDRLIFNNTSVGRSGTIIKWLAPQGGTYLIEAYGASGGIRGNYGRGSKVQGIVEIGADETIKILVGQMGGLGGTSGGGGGGTFVVRQDNSPLLIAGGGGGIYTTSSSRHVSDASIGTSGHTALSGYSGGVNGYGGAGNKSSGASGGGGLLSSGGAGNYGSGGASFLAGGAGGTSNTGPAIGGFGGGGGTHGSSGGGGGGGGYSGGGGGYHSESGGNGGGGGSYISGDDQSGEPGVRAGHGYVVITLVKASLFLFKTGGKIYSYIRNELKEMPQADFETFHEHGMNLKALTTVTNKERKTLKEEYVNGNRFLIASILPETWDRQISSIVAETTSPALFLMESKDSIKSVHDNALVIFNRATVDMLDDFEARAMESFSAWQTPINRVDYEADAVSVFSDGWIIKKGFVNDESMIRIMTSGIAVGSKFIVKSLDKFYNLSLEGEWHELELIEPLNKGLIAENGTDRLGEVPSMKWKELGTTFEVYTWVDDWKFVETVTEAEKQIVSTGTLFKTELNDFSKVNGFSFENQ